MDHFKIIENSDQPDFVKDFAAEVREEIYKRGLKLKWVSEKAGLHRDVLSHFLCGHTFPKTSSLEAIADVLGMKIVMCIMEKEIS